MGMERLTDDQESEHLLPRVEKAREIWAGAGPKKRIPDYRGVKRVLDMIAQAGETVLERTFNEGGVFLRPNGFSWSGSSRHRKDPERTEEINRKYGIRSLWVAFEPHQTVFDITGLNEEQKKITVTPQGVDVQVVYFLSREKT